jgi:hypothetical protein
MAEAEGRPRGDLGDRGTKGMPRAEGRPREGRGRWKGKKKEAPQN